MPNHRASSSQQGPEYSPYASTQQRRVEFASRETEQKFSFVFFSPDESFGGSEDKSDALSPSLSATMASMDNPEFVSAACASLLALENALPRPMAASGGATPQATGLDETQRQALIAACLQTMQQHLPALLAQLARRQQAATSAFAATTAFAGSTSATPTVSSLPSFSTAATGATATATATLASTPPAPPSRVTGKTPSPCGPEQVFFSKLRREVPTIITERFGPLLQELKTVLDKPGHRAKHGEASCTKALTAFTRISTQLMQASRCANVDDGVNCREALRRAADALEEFRGQHLSWIIRLFPGGDSPIPSRTERAFKERLRELASQIDALLDDPAVAMRESGRERANSSPMTPPRPSSGSAVPPGSPHHSENSLADKRIRHFSANARTPRKLAREASRGKRGSDTPSTSTPAPQTTAAAPVPGPLSTSSTPQPNASPAPLREHANAQPSPRGLRREKENG